MALTPVTPIVALSLDTLRLSPNEDDLVRYHLGRIGTFRESNKRHEAYYEGRQRVRNLGISIPPQLQDVETVVGWPGTVVDVLEERLDWQGWTADDGNDFGLGDVYSSNALDVDMGLALLDALIYGTAFVEISAGDPGEPSPLVTVESPMRMTGAWDARKRRLSSAFSVDEIVNGRVQRATLYLPNENLTLDASSGAFVVAERDQHNLGRVTVVQLVNRPRASRTEGRSEITRAVRAYTDQGVRTLLGMEVNREFYSAPQRWIMGADESGFADSDGNVRTGWEAIMGRVLALPKDEDGDTPTVGTFTPASPAPYLEQVRGLSQMLAAEGAIPAPYLGFVTENPSSADAIRQAESRLIKRAERRQTVFGRDLKEVGYVSLLVRDGEVDPAYATTVTTKWRDAATPTRSAAADEAVKLIGAGVLPADSTVTFDRLGLSPTEQRQLASDHRRAKASTAVTALAAAAAAARQDPAVAALEANNGNVQPGQ